MKLISVVIGVSMCSVSLGFGFSPSIPKRYLNVNVNRRIPNVLLQAAAETEAESEADKLRRRARDLLAEVKQAENALHSTLIEKKKSRDSATDALIDQVFPAGDSRSTSDLVDRLRSKRLASDVLVNIVERLHEREIAARGLEHVEPSMNSDHVTFQRVEEPNEVELKTVEGLIDRLIEAASILDEEFLNRKSDCDEKMTHVDLMHWGGGNMAGILKEKAKELGREYDEQFRKRLESFYDAARKKHSRDEVDSRGWKDGDAWNP